MAGVKGLHHLRLGVDQNERLFTVENRIITLESVIKVWEVFHEVLWPVVTFGWEAGSNQQGQGLTHRR